MARSYTVRVPGSSLRSSAAAWAPSRKPMAYCSERVVLLYTRPMGLPLAS